MTFTVVLDLVLKALSFVGLLLPSLETMLSSLIASIKASFPDSTTFQAIVEAADALVLQAEAGLPGIITGIEKMAYVVATLMADFGIGQHTATTQAQLAVDRMKQAKGALKMAKSVKKP